MKWVATPVFLGVLGIALPGNPPPHALTPSVVAVVEVADPVVREAPEQLTVPMREVGAGPLRLFIPQACLPDGKYDLLLHFHGAPPTLRRAIDEAGLHAVVGIWNLGPSSNEYAARFTGPTGLGLVLEQVSYLVDRACPATRHTPRRVALSAWSAGYAAVQALVADPVQAARVDAVLLADGMHSSLPHPRSRQLPPRALEPLVRFARHAVAGEKLMVVTHSSVPTYDYASTTESSDFLLHELSLTRAPADANSIAGMMPRTRVSAGHFLLLGFAGGDEAAHAQHLFGFGRLLATPLRERWEGVAPPVALPPSAPSAPITVTVEVKEDESCTQLGAYVECRPAR